MQNEKLENKSNEKWKEFEVDEIPLDKYIELYTSQKTALEFKIFEEKVLNQPPISKELDTDRKLELKWCLCDSEDYTGLVIRYCVRRESVTIADGIYYDDSFYSFAESEGLQHWLEIIGAAFMDC